MNINILIIEDDLAFGTMLSGWFKKNGFSAKVATNITDARKEILKNPYSLILSDLRLPDGDGIMLLQWIKEIKKDIPFIIMTSYADVSTAVLAMKLGAEDYLQKPINPAILREKIDSVLNSAKPKETAPRKNKSKILSSGFVAGKSLAAKTMQDHILRVAPTKMTVLILGESGTGKEFAARLIHDNSTRKDAPFIAIDCGALSGELAPSELFGHLKGSFTSAHDNKTGIFEQAKGGTVFLDEIGNLSYEVQVQLLRALQEKKIRPVGSAKDIDIDVRIIAATNENMISAISEGVFREDLYHRLNEFSISVPPLRERADDIMTFANEFLKQANEELEKDITGFDAEAQKILIQYSWSGNLRELRNVVRRSALFANSDIITEQDLPQLTSAKIETEDLALNPGNEKEQIEKALKKARGNKTLAAKLLKIDRKTLYNKIHLFNIKP